MIYTIPLQSDEDDKEIQYTGDTAKDIIEDHYGELFHAIWIFELEDHIDIEDWLNEKTFFNYNKLSKQWESHTLELISETNYFKEVNNVKS